MDEKTFDEEDVVALFERPAGTVIQMISALAVDIVIELDAVYERHLKKIDKKLEGVRLHGAVHEQHVVIVVIEPECVAFDDLYIGIFGRPAAGDCGNIGIDLNARYFALKAAA